MDELIFYRKNALLSNLCKEWNTKWSNCHGDKEKLMQLVLARQAMPHFATFCYNGAGVSKDYCLREFGDYVNGKLFKDVDGVEGYTSCMYVDTKELITINADTTHLMWCDNVDVTIPETKCSVLYVSNKSSVHLTLEGYNTVLIYLFDESEVIIEDADETCEVIVYRYSDNSKVERGTFCISPKVKIFNKLLKL